MADCPRNKDLRESTAVLDRLAAGAVDTLEFCSLWQRAGGALYRRAGGAKHDGAWAEGVLTRAEIEERLVDADTAKRMAITPLLDGGLTDTGVNLRVGFSVVHLAGNFATAGEPDLTIADSGRMSLPRLWRAAARVPLGERFVVQPGATVVIATLEWVLLPWDCLGQVITRPSYGRLGLITPAATAVRPGVMEPIALEVVNVGVSAISLTPGVSLAHLVVTSGDTCGADKPV